MTASDVESRSGAAKPFEGVLGTTTELVIAQHFVATRDLPFTQAEIAQLTNRSRQAVGKTLKKFESWGLLKSTSHGNQVLYSLNEASGLASAMDYLNGALIEKTSGIEVLPRSDGNDILCDWRERERAEPNGWEPKGWVRVKRQAVASR